KVAPATAIAPADLVGMAFVAEVWEDRRLVVSITNKSGNGVFYAEAIGVGYDFPEGQAGGTWRVPWLTDSSGSPRHIGHVQTERLVLARLRDPDQPDGRPDLYLDFVSAGPRKVVWPVGSDLRKVTVRIRRQSADDFADATFEVGNDRLGSLIFRKVPDAPAEIALDSGSPDARPADARADARAPVAMACTADIQGGMRLLSMLTNVGEPGKCFAEGTAISRSSGEVITDRRWRVPWEDDRSGSQRQLDKRDSARLNLATFDIAARKLWLAGTKDDLSEDFSVPLEPSDQLQLQVTITREDAATSAIAAFVIELDSGENLRFRAR
ncbi:MAG TPA: hypothetical protein VNF47_20835, partial [Streptosporangiaceae bacterium]|nr:hypothetical protein [Streptosporangiaceae bacterium]